VHHEKEQPKSGPDGFRCILHVDMDAFFATVSLRDKPHLKDKPVVITSSSKGAHSEISCANYPARRLGIKRGYSLQSARDKCKDVVSLPYDFAQYMAVAEVLYRSLFQVSPYVNGLSCDEAYVDITHLFSGVTGPERNQQVIEIVKSLRATIFEKTRGCTASIGVGNSMLLARIATSKAKPDGFYWFSAEKDAELLRSIDIRELPQIGYKLNQQISLQLDVHKCGQLEKIPMETLCRHFGKKTGEMIYKHCRGIDSRGWLKPSLKERKQISAQISWGVRMETQGEVQEFIEALSQELVHRLETAETPSGASKLTLTLWKAKPKINHKRRKGFLGHGICEHITRSVRLPINISSPDQFSVQALKLFSATKCEPEEVRGLGLSASDFGKSTILGNFFAPKTTVSTSSTQVNVGVSESNMGSSRGNVSSDIPPASPTNTAVNELTSSSDITNVKPSPECVVVSDCEETPLCETSRGGGDCVVLTESQPSPRNHTDNSNDVDKDKFNALVQEITHEIDRLGVELTLIGVKRKRGTCGRVLCPGNDCNFEECFVRESISRLCGKIWGHCMSFGRRNKLSKQFLATCEAYCKYKSPPWKSYFFQCCSQMSVRLISSSYSI